METFSVLFSLWNCWLILCILIKLVSIAISDFDAQNMDHNFSAFQLFIICHVSQAMIFDLFSTISADNVYLPSKIISNHSYLLEHDFLLKYERSLNTVVGIRRKYIFVAVFVFCHNASTAYLFQIISWTSWTFPILLN